MGAAGFWDDQANATKVSSQHAQLSRRLETYRSVEQDVGDLSSLVELVEEDEDLADELEEQLQSLEERLAELEEERLFQGQYDAVARCHHQRGHRRHRRAGLGRDGAAHDDALGRAPRVLRRAAGAQRG